MKEVLIIIGKLLADIGSAEFGIKR